MGEFLKSFKSRVDYESGKTGTYPSISFIEGDNTVEYEKRSFITATYEIDSNTISKYPDEIPLIRNTRISGYNIDGEYSEKFTKTEKTANLEFTQVIIDTDQEKTTIIPNEEFFITGNEMNENFQLTLSRGLIDSDYLVLTMIPPESTEYMSELIPIGDLIQEGQINVSEDGLIITISDELTASLKENINNSTADGRVAIFMASETDILNYPNGITDLNVSLYTVNYPCPTELTYPTPTEEKVIKVTYELFPEETSIGDYNGTPLKYIDFNLLRDKEYQVVDYALKATKLRDVVFPDPIVRLGIDIFGGGGGTNMTLVNSLRLGDKITNTEGAFVGLYPSYIYLGKGITNVTSTSVPNSCVSITFSENTERIEYLNNLDMRFIVIPKSVKYFGGISGEKLSYIGFSGCNPETPEDGFIIGDCPMLSSISLGKNWTRSLRNVIHNHLPALKSFIIPPLVTEIPENFCKPVSSGSGDLQTLYIGRGIRNIHYKAFAPFGGSLTEVYCFCKKPPHIDGYYEMNGITTTGTLYCPKGTLDEWNSSSDNHLGALLKKLGWTIQEIPDGITEENPYGTEETNEE